MRYLKLLTLLCFLTEAYFYGLPGYTNSCRRVRFEVPGFDTSLNPADISPAFEDKEIVVNHWQSDRVSVLIQNGGHNNIVEVRIEITGELTVSLESAADFEQKFKDLLFNSNTRRTEESQLGVYRYSNLNWLALVTWLKKDPSADFSGRDWYLNYIEPFIEKSGVSIIGLLGVCIDDPVILRFYRRLGFFGSVTVGSSEDG
ncbi:MAG TPA: hypothetical protein ENN78_00525, partial [Candidatus Omnitrophica bacterium]|nr:hypothetical protein [Candidatus Omnitrophota bacterium]